MKDANEGSGMTRDFKIAAAIMACFAVIALVAVALWLH